HFAASLPLASFSTGSLSTWQLLLLCAVIGFAGWLLLRRKPAIPSDLKPIRLRPQLVAAAVLLIVAGAVWYQDVAAAPSRLRVSILDVGQGDSILIQTPSGRRVLVDSGPSGDRLMQDLGRELPASAHHIDLMVLSHGEDDHISGFITLLR